MRKRPAQTPWPALKSASRVAALNLDNGVEWVLWDLAAAAAGAWTLELAADIPLTERGRRRARALKFSLASQSFERVLTSPLSRARETAEPPCAGKPRGWRR